MWVGSRLPGEGSANGEVPARCQVGPVWGGWGLCGGSDVAGGLERCGWMGLRGGCRALVADRQCCQCGHKAILWVLCARGRIYAARSAAYIPTTRTVIPNPTDNSPASSGIQNEMRCARSERSVSHTVSPRRTIRMLTPTIASVEGQFPTW